MNLHLIKLVIVNSGQRVLFLPHFYIQPLERNALEYFFRITFLNFKSFEPLADNQTHFRATDRLTLFLYYFNHQNSVDYIKNRINTLDSLRGFHFESFGPFTDRLEKQYRILTSCFLVVDRLNSRAT